MPRLRRGQRRARRHNRSRRRLVRAVREGPPPPVRADGRAAGPSGHPSRCGPGVGERVQLAVPATTEARCRRARGEREAWAREDARRTFDQRRDCYSDFLKQLREAGLAAYNAGYELAPPLEFGWNLPLYEALLRFRVFASPEASTTAEQAYNAAWRWGDAGGTVNEAPFHEGQDAFDAAEIELLAVIRADLGVDAAIPTQTSRREDLDA